MIKSPIIFVCYYYYLFDVAKVSIILVTAKHFARKMLSINFLLSFRYNLLYF